MTITKIQSPLPSGEVLLASSTEALLLEVGYVGGKARQLAWLSHNQYPVPDWFVVTTHVFKAHIQRAGVPGLLADKLSHLDAEQRGALLAQWREAIVATSLAEAEVELIEKRLSTFGEQFVAVRSSAVDEDGADASFAGQMDSFLFRQGATSVIAAIVACFASVYSDRAIAYRLEKGLKLDDIAGAVVVQAMVDSEVSGVLFSANPNNGQRDEILVSACYGLGEGVVSGECETDEFVLQRQTGGGNGDSLVKSQTIAVKDQALRFAREQGTGLVKLAVDPQQQNSPCLTRDQLQQLRAAAVSISRALEAPQDIEWAFVGEQLSILQTRPITRLPYAVARKGNRFVWDNSNIEESYSGVCLPLTLSFARMAYKTVYEQTMKALGFGIATVASEHFVFDHLIGYFRGRPYYNINHWYHGLSYLPGFKTNKDDLERMMGLADPVDFIVDKELSLGDKIRKTPGLIVNLIRLLREFSRIHRSVDHFQQHFQAVYQTFDREDFQSQQLAELYLLTQRLKSDLLESWEVPIYNDFYVMMMNGKVRRLLEKAGVAEANTLQNNLLAGEEGVESTEPTKALLAIADAIKQDGELRSLLAAHPPQQWLLLLEIQAPAIARRCDAYRERYGDRCIGEQKFETVSVRQDPAFMLSVLDNYLNNDELSAEKLAARERATRAAAEQIAFAAIKKTLGAGKLKTFKKVLTNFRLGVKNRENMRLNRSRMFGLFRSVYLEMGRQLALHRVIEQAGDIFYLTVTELDDYFTGVCIQTNFKALVAARREEYQDYKGREVPHHFATTGMIYHETDYVYPGQNPLDSDASVLQGTGCYPGKVTQPVRLILDPGEATSIDGKILCTRRTDPGWAPLFPSAAGILVERGSTLSHSAVVARELGIPAIVGIPGLTKIIKDGQRVEMCGSSGKVILQ